jgi:hypothetical protein
MHLLYCATPKRFARACLACERARLREARRRGTAVEDRISEWEFLPSTSRNRYNPNVTDCNHFEAGDG